MIKNTINEVERRIWSAPPARKYSTPGIAEIAGRMHRRLASETPDFEIGKYLTTTFPLLRTVLWRGWLTDRLRDLPWIDRSYSLDGRNDVPDMWEGPALRHGITGQDARRIQKYFRIMGVPSHSEVAELLIGLILVVLETLDEEFGYVNE